jgi:hypothetical protein
MIQLVKERTIRYNSIVSRLYKTERRKLLLLASRSDDAYLTIALDVRWCLHGKGEPARLSPLCDLETCVQLVAREW